LLIYNVNAFEIIEIPGKAAADKAVRDKAWGPK
jgi:hypothetical protein